MKTIKLVELKQQVHSDLKNLLICKKDIIDNQNIKWHGKEFVLSKDEPSAMPDEFEVEPVDEYDSVIPLLGYSFTFDMLNAEQKYIYTKFLCNPYSGEFSIGYVYLFYCGLERLFFTNTNQVVDIILKLRDAYKEKSSFRNYSAKMLLYMSAVMNDKKLFKRTVESINLKDEIQYIEKYYIFAKYKLNIPLDAYDFILLANKFGFANKLYINKYPEIFLKCLESIISNKYKNGYVPLSKCISLNKKNGITYAFTPFANLTIACGEINTEISEENKKTIFTLLQETHNTVKDRLAKLRKTGEMPEAKIPSKRTPIPMPVITAKAFAKMEQELMVAFDKAVGAEEKYNKCCDLCKHYFTYRKENSSYSENCLKYCEICLSLIHDVLQEYDRKKKQEQVYLKKQIEQFTKSNDDFMQSIIQRSIDGLERKYCFWKKIVAFKYMVTIFSEQEKITQIISVCDRALEYYAELKPIFPIAIMSKSQEMEFFRKEKSNAEEKIK